MRAGWACVDLAPRVGLELSGYGYYLDRRAQGTLDPICARALVLDDGRTRAAVVQLDLLALSAAQAESIRAQVAAIGVDHTMLHCTHTHSGPATRPLFGCGEPAQDWLERLVRGVVQAVQTASDDCAPVSRAGEFEVPFAGFATNRAGGSALDPFVRGVTLERDGPPIVVFQYACHPVTLGRNSLYSADFPGAALAALTGWRGVFLNGCCGDLNPRVEHGTGPQAQAEMRRNGEALAAAVNRGLAERQACALGPIHVRQRMIEVAEGTAPKRPDIRRPQQALADAAWASHRAMNPGPVQAELQVIRLGEVEFVGVGAEAFSAHGAALRAASTARRSLVAGTTNGVVGYLPDAADVHAGRYASTRGARIYGMPYPAPNAGAEWVARGVELLV